MSSAVGYSSAATSREVRAWKTPPASSDDGGVFPFSGTLAALAVERHGQVRRRFNLPISTLLARIRKLIPDPHDDHYEEIARGFGNGALRSPPSPMSDRELARAIAEFLKEAPSAESVSSLGRKLDPSSPV